MIWIKSIKPYYYLLGVQEAFAQVIPSYVLAFHGPNVYRHLGLFYRFHYNGLLRSIRSLNRNTGYSICKTLSLLTQQLFQIE